MKNFIRQLLRENPQLADKIYFNSGKLSPRVKEIIFKITNGDPFTKLITDIYFYMLMEGHSNGNWALSQLDPNHQATEKPENDVMDIEQWRKLKSIYNELKEYNKNVFPISGFNINGVENIGYFLSALKQRTSILNIMKTWPSIALRNMKADIRQERTYPELQDYRSDLEHFDALYSQLSNRNEDAKRKIENKMFRSNITLEDLIDFAEEKENLLGGEELTRKQIGQIIKQEQQENDELRVRYSKDNIMIIEVTGPHGIKKIGCNSVWCFTYNRHGGSTNWNDWDNNSTDGFAYVIVDFNEPSNSPNFMYVLTKPLMYDYSDVGSEGDDRLYDMSNHNVEEPNEQISRLLDFETAKKVMNFGFKEPKEKQKKQKFVDPAQYSLELSEGKSFIKQLLRESIINEGVSDITYHFNHIGRTQEILKSNQINLSAAFGTQTDKDNNKGKLFFLSTTSSRSSDIGYAASLSKNSLVRITLNGRKIKHNYQTARVDYWQRPKDPRNGLYNPHDEETTGKGFYKNISRQDELEDRLISDKNVIKPANKYIISIEVLNTDMEDMQHTKHLCDKLGIEFYAYDNEAYFNGSIKNKSINVNSKEKKSMERSDGYIDTDMIAYLGFKDEQLKEKIYTDLGNMGVDVDSIKPTVETRIKEKLNYYLRTEDDFYLKDFANSMASNVHNKRSSANEIDRYLIRQLGLDMKKNNVSSVLEYLRYKVWKGKKTQKMYNKELNEKILNFIDASLKENLDYYNITSNKTLEVNNVYYENLLQYEPISKFLNKFITELKKYYSDYILNNNDMFKYSYTLARGYVIKALNLDKKTLMDILNPIFNDIEWTSNDVTSEEFFNVIYYLLSDLDRYQYDEIKKLQQEEREQW